MRINTATLDPTSPLAARITAALARDESQRVRLPVSEPSGQADDTGHANEPESVLHDAVVGLLRTSAMPGTFWTHFPAGEKRSEATGRKLARMGTKPGVPDFALVVDGRALFLELKSRSGSLSKVQKLAHAEIIRAGAEVIVVRCVQSAADQLRRWRAIV